METLRLLLHEELQKLPKIDPERDKVTEVVLLQVFDQLLRLSVELCVPVGGGELGPQRDVHNLAVAIGALASALSVRVNGGPAAAAAPRRPEATDDDLDHTSAGVTDVDKAAGVLRLRPGYLSFCTDPLQPHKRMVMVSVSLRSECEPNKCFRVVREANGWKSDHTSEVYSCLAVMPCVADYRPVLNKDKVKARLLARAKTAKAAILIVEMVWRVGIRSVDSDLLISLGKTAATLPDFADLKHEFAAMHRALAVADIITRIRVAIPTALPVVREGAKASQTLINTLTVLQAIGDALDAMLADDDVVHDHLVAIEKHVTVVTASFGRKKAAVLHSELKELLRLVQDLRTAIKDLGPSKLAEATAALEKLVVVGVSVADDPETVGIFGKVAAFFGTSLGNLEPLPETPPREFARKSVPSEIFSIDDAAPTASGFNKIVDVGFQPLTSTAASTTTTMTTTTAPRAVPLRKSRPKAAVYPKQDEIVSTLVVKLLEEPDLFLALQSAVDIVESAKSAHLAQ